MIQIRTRPINTHPARASTGSSALSSLPKGLSRMSSMRAALNSQYCMRAQIFGHASQGNTSDGDPTCPPKPRRRREGLLRGGGIGEQIFAYKEGQHHVKRGKVAFNATPVECNQHNKLHLPEEVKITKTKNGKRWSTSSMEVELAKDILEVRDGLGKPVDAVVLKSKV